MRAIIGSIKRQRNWDGRGSIEGLPLQLMIVGLIASLGTAIIVGWISSIETPIYVDHIEIVPRDILVSDPDGDGLFEAEIELFTLRVLDTTGKTIENARVILEGACINNAHHRLYGITEEEGLLSFEDLSISVVGDRISTIAITVTGQGIANEFQTEIMVIPT